jgi:cytidine deaminase
MAESRPPRLSRVERELVAAALDARRQAYAPYSRFRVGAALRAAGGAVYIGCNVENASYGATVCAERNAVAAAVVAGERELEQLAIATGTSPAAPPCGLCRQVLGEFAPRLRILLVNPQGEAERTRLDRLLPRGFFPQHL